MARALHYLHELRPAVLHRDLKLDNVMLSCPQLARAEAKLVSVQRNPLAACQSTGGQPRVKAGSTTLCKRSPAATSLPVRFTCQPTGHAAGILCFSLHARSSCSTAGLHTVQADFGLARMHHEAPMGKGSAAALPPTLACDAEQVNGSQQTRQKPLGSAAAPCLTGKTGSLGYMAPEVLSSLPYGASADVFR
jgi:serine/threonine protein kinase